MFLKALDGLSKKKTLINYLLVRYVLQRESKNQEHEIVTVCLTFLQRRAATQLGKIEEKKN